MKQHNIAVEAVEEKMASLETEGKTAMLIAIDNELAGLVAVADTVKETSKAAIARMKSLGLEVIMLTGDNEKKRQQRLEIKSA